MKKDIVGKCMRDRGVGVRMTTGWRRRTEMMGREGGREGGKGGEGREGGRKEGREGGREGRERT